MLETKQISYPTPALQAVHLTGWEIVELTGSDRLTFLSGLVSNEVKALSTGEGNASFILTSKGRITRECIIVAMPEKLLILTSPNDGQALIEALEFYHFTEDIKMTVCKEQWLPILLYGTELPAWFANQAKADFPESHKGSDVASIFEQPSELWATNVSIFKELPSLFLWISQEQLKVVDDALKNQGFQHTETSEWELHRTWFRWFDSKGILKDRLIHETGLEHSHVSYTKGCFVGQEVVARTEHRGKSNQGLFILQAPKDLRLSSQQKIIDATGKTVGEILKQLPISLEQFGYCSLLKLKAVEQKTDLFVQATETEQIPLQLVELAPSN